MSDAPTSALSHVSERSLERLRPDFRGKPPVAALAQQDSADRAPLYMAVESFRGQRNGGRSDRRHNAR